MGGKHDLLPFKVGQSAESRSFLKGFRGAWFRCKIKEISWKQNQMGHVLEFIDFPDEKKKWTKLYQKPPMNKTKAKEIRTEMMVRPDFPPVYRESQMPDLDKISEVTVMVDDVWKVGDLVDWWTSDCYWSARVTQLLGDDKATIQLPDPPIGEGLSYDVCCRDLRPSLDWSPEHGWTVPIPKEGENPRRCAQLIQPVKLACSLPPPDRSVQSPVKASEEQSPGDPENKEHTRETNLELDMADSGTGKSSFSDSASSSLFRDTRDGMTEATAEDLYCNGGPFKKMRSGGSIPLNSDCSDTLDAAIMDLEELVNKVKWLKGVLEFGIPTVSAMQPSWKFLEHRSTSRSK